MHQWPQASRASVPSSPFTSDDPHASRQALSALAGFGPDVDPRAHVEPGTRSALAVAATFAVVLALFLVFTIYGALFALLGAAASWFAARKARVVLRGSALRVGPRQLPQIHACAEQFARRLGLERAPEIYVVDAAEVNGFALRFGRSHAIVLTDETVAAALEGKSPGALSFVIAHELAHVALGHTSFFRALLRRSPKLSRCDELSADAVACALVGSTAAAQDGILLLTAGPRLLAFVDRVAALEQAGEVVADKASGRVERNLTHPLTLRRLQRVASRGDDVVRSLAA